MGQIDDFFTNYFYLYFSISYESNMKNQAFRAYRSQPLTSCFPFVHKFSPRRLRAPSRGIRKRNTRLAEPQDEPLLASGEIPLIPPSSSLPETPLPAAGAWPQGHAGWGRRPSTRNSSRANTFGEPGTCAGLNAT